MLTMQQIAFLFERAMLALESVYAVLEAVDGRFCQCSSVGQTVHDLMCGACVLEVMSVCGCDW